MSHELGVGLISRNFSEIISLLLLSDKLIVLDLLEGEGGLGLILDSLSLQLFVLDLQLISNSDVHLIQLLLMNPLSLGSFVGGLDLCSGQFLFKLSGSSETRLQYSDGSIFLLFGQCDSSSLFSFICLLGKRLLLSLSSFCS